MKASIIKIGNSRGVIIPQGLLKALGLGESSPITFQVHSEGILIKKESARAGWSEAAQMMRENNDDDLLIPEVFEDETLDEW
jgi:hypothetical protein